MTLTMILVILSALAVGCFLVALLPLPGGRDDFYAGN